MCKRMMGRRVRQEQGQRAIVYVCVRACYESLRKHNVQQTVTRMVKKNIKIKQRVFSNTPFSCNYKIKYKSLQNL